MRPGIRIWGVGLGVLAGIVGIFAARPVLLERLELSLLDWRFRVRGVVETTGRVAIVAIDERSVDELGRWPWRRSVMARLLDRLTEARVAAIGLDIVFSEPEISAEQRSLGRLGETLEALAPKNPELWRALRGSLEDADTDRLLVESLRRSGRTVLGYFFRTAATAGDSAASLEKVLPLLRKSRVAVSRLPRDGVLPVLTCSGAEPNLEVFTAAARHLGFFSTLRDPDGVVRRAPLVARCGGELYVSLALALLETVEGRRALVLGDASGLREIRLGATRLPVDEGGRILIDFRGPTGTFPQLSAADVLAGRVDPARLEGRIVLVGATEVGIGDLGATPFSTVFPGVEVHANVLDNLLSGRVLRHHDDLLLAELAAVILLGLAVCAAGAWARRASQLALAAAGLLGLWVGSAVLLFSIEGIWINLTYPGLTLLCVYIGVGATHAITVEAQARLVRREFATYVPPQVVDQMVDHPERFRLGGERRPLAMLFSDLRDFSMLAEELDAEAVSLLLNTYLTEMTRIVFDTHGTLDKYVGDAVVAFWGAPLEVPDHAQRACEAALAMQEGVARLRATRADLAGADRLRVGIGIHCGSVVVGNLGSDLRFDYSTTGDAVNLCSRLEGLTKFYGVGILTSQDMVTSVRGFAFRELDTVRVKGKRQSVRIFELIGRHAAAAGRHLEAYADGLAAYRAGRWQEAEVQLLRASELRGGADRASRLLLERMRERRHVAPPGWDGIWTFEEK